MIKEGNNNIYLVMRYDLYCYDTCFTCLLRDGLSIGCVLLL